MQIGRWNHQGSSDSNSGSGQHKARRRSEDLNPEDFKAYAIPARGGRGDRRSPGRSGRRFDDRGGNGRRGGSFSAPRRARGGFRSFGETETEIQKFINRAPTIEEADAPYNPKHRFGELPFLPKLKENIERKGYDLPTPIQDQVIPEILAGKDVVGLAETGSGKTAAFLLPLIQKVMLFPEERVLIMAPTRELAVQIETELASFARGLGFRGMVAVGGANIMPQIKQLKWDPSFVIGTPGRLKDLMERKSLDLSRFGTVVLDEADRMLDMGFIDDMRFILGKMRAERHTLFFSATMGKDIEALIGDFLRNPVVISVKKRDTSANVDQDVVRIGGDKFEQLCALLEDREFTRTLIFVRTKHGAERLAKMLSRKRIFADSIHGDKSHNARLRALEAFKRGKVNVLVATDVAARGLDIPEVSHVINYDLPGTYEDYVHRIGRTGRASAKGKALTFVG